MSSEEQATLAGRLALEYAELGKDLAAHIAKACEQAARFDRLRKYLAHSGITPDKFLRDGFLDANLLAEIPEPTDVKLNCEKVIDLIERRTQIYESLSSMGIPPQGKPTR